MAKGSLLPLIRADAFVLGWSLVALWIAAILCHYFDVPTAHNIRHKQ